MKFRHRELVWILSPLFMFLGNMYANADAGANAPAAQQPRVTADQQSMTSHRDTEMTRQIRERISQNGSLSTAAKNITIVTANGQVTLSGMVANKDEKVQVERIARSVSGIKTLINQTVISR